MSSVQGELDIEKLLLALDNDDNKTIVDLDFTKIAQVKNDMLQKLNVHRDALKRLTSQLKQYRYVESLDELRFGSYVRWISLLDPATIKLTNGGFICDMKIKNEDVHVVCKNRFGQLFQMNLTHVMMFQKLSEQEMVILSAMKYLH